VSALRGALAPHVLWFDEAYDEPRFFFHTARRVGSAATLLIVIGTSAQTNLPWQVVTLASQAGATIVDINLDDNPFGDIAGPAMCVRAPAATALPALVAAIVSR